MLFYQLFPFLHVISSPEHVKLWRHSPQEGNSDCKLEDLMQSSLELTLLQQDLAPLLAHGVLDGLKEIVHTLTETLNVDSSSRIMAVCCSKLEA